MTKNYLIALVANHVIFYPTPTALTYAWTFGSLAGVTLVIQIISGFILSMFYVGDTRHAFNSIIFIMRDVNYGWLIRYIHSNGASMFFIMVYAHMIRGLYYGSYMAPKQSLWCSGVLLLILMMATAFTGYVLPWSQMSFWGATVISNMVTVIPYVGKKIIVEWIWGAQVVNNYTLKRIYSLHFYLPFAILGMTFIHLILLHLVSSTDPIASDPGIDDVNFYVAYFQKDYVGLIAYLCFFSMFVTGYPMILNHPDHYVWANPMKTPAHVVPEWYFLLFYAILWSVPFKTSGILTMVLSVLIFFSIPYTYYSVVRSTEFRPVFKFCFWWFLHIITVLSFIGQAPLLDHYKIIGQLYIIQYFLFFFISIPFAGRIEEYLQINSNFNIRSKGD